MNTASATFPQNPNPNRNLNSNPNVICQSATQNPNPNPNILTSSSSPPLCDLSTTLSSLTALISLSEKTLNSLSESLTLNPHLLLPEPQNANLVPCPFNQHHRMPPEALFLHSLHCPSPLNLTPFLGSLNYPNTLKSSSELQNESRLVQPIQDPSNSELCFSWDDYFDFGSSFFYKDCSGVVDFCDVDGVKKTFDLPRVLFVECANFAGSREREVNGFHKEGFRILPSDLWAIRSEIDGWRDYPATCSFNVVCTILGSKKVKENDLRKWIIANSPRYGVVIDVFMRDHIFVLFSLGLKAIVTEAFGLVELAVNSGDFKGDELEKNLKGKSFTCPVLVQVLMWLASQLSVLYGELNAKFFAINMLRQSILESMSRLSLLVIEENNIETAELIQGPEEQLEISAECELDRRVNKSTDCSCKRLDNDGTEIRGINLERPLNRSAEFEVKGFEESINESVIFVSQVAAAVAALHEFSLLEGKIRRLRFPQPLTGYQRMAEHDMLSKRADEERKKRPNYRPIIDHDGLPRHQSSDQETSRTKTREELLAEERDYKRRRMSYRGKKVKRTTLQVMRDIIDEYMQEIKQSGGIGWTENVTEEGVVLPCKPVSTDDIGMDVDQLKSADGDTSGAAMHSPGQYRKELNYDYRTRSASFEDALPKAYEWPRSDRQGHHERFVDVKKTTDRDKHSKGYSGSAQRRRSYNRSYEQSGNQMEKDDAELNRTRHHAVKRLSSNRDRRSSYSMMNSSNDKRRRNTEHYSSDYGMQNAFEDRYDPSESHDVYEDEAFIASK